MCKNNLIWNILNLYYCINLFTSLFVKNLSNANVQCYKNLTCLYNINTQAEQPKFICIKYY